jgi:dephospho-CoA kinase
VKTAMLDQIQELLKGNAPKMVVLEVPLLFEAGFDDIVDAVIVVKSSQRVQIERVAKSRSMKRKEIMLRFYHQMPQSEKLEHADFIIDNRYTKAGTRAQVKQIWDGLVSV